MPRILGLLVTIALPLTIAACDDGSPSAGASRPGVVTEYDEQLMARAIQKARDTQGELVVALAANNPNFSGFAVKKPYPVPGSTEGEHIWINDVTWDGQAFTGVVNNEPVDTKAVTMGDRVTVAPHELTDWIYIDGNKVVGGYTLRVIHHQSSPEEQKAFVEQTGLEVPPVDF